MRSLLKDLVIDEIAICFEGMNPGADILLVKARHRKKPKNPCEKAVRRAAARRRSRKARLLSERLDEAHQQLHEDGEIAFRKIVELAEVFAKDEHVEPQTFDEIFEDRRLHDIDEALDRRTFALAATTFGIITSDIEDKEQRILEAVEAFAVTMREDVPRLFAGEIVKTFSKSDGPASFEDVHADVLDWLELAEWSAPSSGGNMQFLKTLTDAGKRALGLIIGDRQPEDVWKSTSDQDGELIAGLLNAAGEGGELLATAAKDLEAVRVERDEAKGELIKLRPADDPASLEEILKGMTPAQQAYFKAREVQAKTDRQANQKLHKAAELAEQETFTKSVGHLPSEGLADLLVKAKQAGILDELQKVLRAAQATIETIGKGLFDEFGSDLDADGTGTSDAAMAEAQIVAKATELRKGTSMTFEQAYAKVLEIEPELYQPAPTLRAN